MLHVHRAERADGLVQRLGDLLRRPCGDPLAAEVVSVPTRGVERWLTQRLAGVLGTGPGRRDGVCANVEFPFPARLLARALAPAAGVDRDEDPWQPERMVWPLLEVVQEAIEHDWMAALATHVGSGGEDDPSRKGRRFGAVRHVADLFDRYAVHRPAMLRAWAAGDDVDGAGRPLRAGAVWQARLWRRLNDRLAVPGPAERLEGACRRLRADPSLADLPERVSIFGLTRLPASYLEALSAIAANRDVHLFLLHPSPALWARIEEDLRRSPAPTLRSADHTAALARNALLASWGRDAREMQLVLSADVQVRDDPRPSPEPPPTLLGRLQAGVAADLAAPGPPLPGEVDARPVLDPDDRSVRVHSCHGRARQVEVVRDAVLHLLADDPTLEPRDVIVMCPDIEAFAPLVQAVFGAGEEADEDGSVPVAGASRPDLRVRLADRSLRQTNPLLGVVSHLLDLAGARATATQVLDLAAREPVRRRFGMDDDEIARLEEWVRASGIRWGLDADHRAPYKLGKVPQGTWRAGLDRILVGVTMAEEDARLVQGVLPLDDVESGAIDLAGRLAELVARLGRSLDRLVGPKPLPEWIEAIAGAADALTACGDEEVWQRAQLDRILDEVGREAGAGGLDLPPLELAEVRALLADRLAGRPTRANFRTGHLTVCTLVPMRSVPHRVVVLMGLDDGVFPRRRERDGDDLTLEEPHVGDSDGRGEDRQLLLDALMAATEHLIVTYAGRDERTNAERPPAVPVGELLDQIDRTVRGAGPDGREAPAREAVRVEHPLQPFDPRNFLHAGIEPGRRWSFDPVARSGAAAMAGPRVPPPAFMEGRLSEADTEAIELDALVRFVQHPVRAFLRRRLGIGLSERDDELSDALSVELDHLEQWGVGTRLLALRLGGVGPGEARAAERARGVLPPGILADRALDAAATAVEKVVTCAAHLTAEGGEPRAVEIDVPLPEGRRLLGSVDGVRGDRLVETTFSRIGPRQRLAAWARMLALQAQLPDRRVEAVTMGRRRSGGATGKAITVSHLGPLVPAEARRQLWILVDLYVRGMREPLPLFCDTSAAWALAAVNGAKREVAAERGWLSTWEWPKEDRDPEHRLVLGGQRSLDDLLRERPADDERGPGWAMDEDTRLGRLARRLWDGLLVAERIEDM